MNEESEVAPGGYRWDPSLEPDGTMSMVVSLTSQKAYVYRGDTLIGMASIASGKPGYRTPDGTFYVLEKERFHHSNKYDNAPMPFMQRLTWYGLALHGGHPHGYPASHGCIRLPMGFAAALFKEDTRGMRVEITGQPPGRGRTMIAGRQKSRTNVQSDNLGSAEFSNGQDESRGAPDEPLTRGLPASQSMPADSAHNDGADDPSDYGSENGDRYYSPDQIPDERYNSEYRRPHERDRSRELPPEDLPPPPD